MKSFKKLTIIAGMALAFGGSAAGVLAQNTIHQHPRPPIGVNQGQRLERAAEMLGMSAEELQAMIDEGKTIKEIAEELGVELPRRPGQGQRLERAAEMLGMSAEELQAMIDEGKTIKEIAEELGVELPRRPGQGQRLERAAEMLGMSAEELQAMIDEGKTIKEIAEELGVELPRRPGHNIRPGRGGFGGPGRSVPPANNG